MPFSRNSVSDALTAFLVVTFGTSTWVSLGGLWVELPLLTNLGIPEGYRIGSYFIIVTQAAVIGPLIFVTCQYFAPKQYHLEIPAIYLTLAIGAVASFLLIFFWDALSYWPLDGTQHSTAFLALAFCMALVDSTSNLTFMPFISSLKAKYINWYFIGEGLSSVIPSFVVLIQGSGGDDICVANETFLNLTYYPSSNTTVVQNCTSWKVEKDGYALFPPKNYFIFIFVLFVLSTTSFCLLRCLHVFRKQYEIYGNCKPSETCVQSQESSVIGFLCSCMRFCRRQRITDEKTPLLTDPVTDAPKESVEDMCNDTEEVSLLKSEDFNENSTTHKQNELHPKPETSTTNLSMIDNETEGNRSQDVDNNSNGKEHTSNFSTSSQSSCPKNYVFLFAILTINSALTYGILPSIQSYSAGAYGAHIYLLATALAEISVPIGFFLVMARPTTSYVVVLLTSVGGLVASGYCMVTASLSPTPPLQEHPFGQTFIILAWILQGLFFSYCRATIGWILRSHGDSRLSMMWFGGCTTVGTMLGAIIMFPLVNSLKLFKSFDPTQACDSSVTCSVQEYDVDLEPF